jgi:hypothetical protein
MSIKKREKNQVSRVTRQTCDMDHETNNHIEHEVQSSINKY